MCKKQIKAEKITGKEKTNTRHLWEEIFTEDTPEFLDYYYSEKLRDNQVLAVKDGRDFLSMLHLNPYTLMLSGKAMQSYYVVAVATKPQYRHQGYMRCLLRKALKQAEQENCPFLFLMPAKEAIYKPFGFVTVYERKDYILEKSKEEKESGTKQVVMEVLESFFQDSDKMMSILQEVFDFYQEVLSDRFDIYARRDISYLKTSLLEQESQKGGMILFRNKEQGKLIGSCYYTREDKLELRELLCDISWEKAILTKLFTSGFCQGKVKLYGADFYFSSIKEEKKVPCIMLRITDLASLHGCLSLEDITEEEPFQEHNIKLLDPLLLKQQGIYHLFEVRRENKSFLGIERIFTEDTYQETLTIEEFTKKYVKKQKIFLNEVV